MTVKKSKAIPRYKDNDIDALIQLGRSLYKQGKYGQAKKCFEQALGKNLNSPPYSEFKEETIVTMLLELGRVLYHQDRQKGGSKFEGAKKHFNAALEAFYASKKCLQDELLVEILIDSGRLYHHLNQNEESQKYLQKALDVFESSKQNIDKALLVCVLQDLGNIAARSNNYKEAIQYFKQALGILKGSKTDILSIKASVLTNLGYNADNLQDNEQALGYYKQAHSLYEKLLKKENGNKANLQSGLLYLLKEYAPFQYHQVNYKEATRLYIRILEIEKRLSNTPNASLNIAKRLQHIARCYYDQNDFINALRYYKQALSVVRKAQGKISLEEAKALECMGLAYYAQGKINLTIKYYEEALEAYKLTAGYSHPDSIDLASRLSNHYKRLDRFEEAKAIYQKIISVSQRKKFDPSQLVKIYNEYAEILYGLMDYKAAEQYYQKCLQLEVQGNAGLPNIILSYRAIGWACLKQDKLNEAEEYFKKITALKNTKYLKEDPREYIHAQFSLLTVFNMSNQKKKMLPLLKGLLSLDENKLGDSKTEIATSLLSIAWFLEQCKKFKESEDVYSRALTYFKNSNINEYNEPFYANLLYNLKHFNQGYKGSEFLIENYFRHSSLQFNIILGRDLGDSGDTFLYGLMSKVGKLRAQLQKKKNVTLPSVRIIDSVALPMNSYLISSYNNPVYFATVPKKRPETVKTIISSIFSNLKDVLKQHWEHGHLL